MHKILSNRIVFLLGSLYLLILVGTVVFSKLEGWTYAESFYFSVITVTTIGYGDLYPTTDASRLFTAIYALVGVAIAIAILGAIGSRYLESRGLLGKYFHTHDDDANEPPEQT